MTPQKPCSSEWGITIKILQIYHIFLFIQLTLVKLNDIIKIVKGEDNMEFHLRGRKDVEDFFATEILDSVATREILDISRQRLGQLKDSGRIVPIKTLAKDNLYLRSEVLALKKELFELRKQKGSKKL